MVNSGCFACGLGGHITRFCPQRVVAHVGPDGHQQNICWVVTHLYCCVALFSHVPCTRRQQFNQFPFLASHYLLLLPSQLNIFCQVKSNAVCLIKLRHVCILHPASHVNPTYYVFHKVYVVHRITHTRLTPTLQAFT